MQNRRTLILIIGLLLSVSLLTYTVHYFVFNDIHDLFFYTLMDLAFLPLQVLIVGIFVERILTGREIAEKISKLNMVVGAFFSEVGSTLAKLLVDSASDRKMVILKLNMQPDWKTEDYKRAQAFASKDDSVDFTSTDLAALRQLLVSKRHFMLTLIENPNLLEHERFTDLLLSVFHLTEELESRPDLTDLPQKDLAHLNVDIRRSYKNLVIEWLDYMQHIKSNYPFLYSHFLRTHPFQPNPSAVIQ